MISIFQRSKMLLFHKITSHSLVLPFAFSSFIVSPQCLKEKSPNNDDIKISCSDTVSYLIDSCGLSPEIAKLASEKVKIKTFERPDSVIKLFSNYGFDNTQISRLVKSNPCILTYDPEKILLPKLQFLHSIGFSKADLAAHFSVFPNMLSTSLKNQIIPLCGFLREVLGSDKKVVSFLKRARFGVHEKVLLQNITALRELNVSASNIVLLANFPEALLQKHDQFKEVVDKVKEMGFDPLKSIFVLAIRVLSGKSNKLIWDRCFETYKRWGWSEDDILSAFKKHPHCMSVSVKKIDGVMDFFVSKMGYQSTVIAKIPAVLFFSLEKRIVPRCSVIQFLRSKGLVRNLSLCSILIPVENIFLDRFVTKYEHKLPQLLSVYRREVKGL